MHEKIKEIVEGYIEKNPEEYKEVCEYITQKRMKLKDSKRGQGEGGYSALYEVPVKLHELFGTKLDPEERQEFARLEHRKWFANEFSEFKLPDEI